MVRSIASFALVASLGIIVAGPGFASRSDGGEHARRFLDRQPEPLEQYRAHRRLEAANERFNLEGWLEAMTVLEQGELRYEILAQGGSKLIRGRVLEAALKGEAKAVRDGDTARAGLDERNYAFGEEVESEDGTVGIAITPLRKDRLLLNGRLFVGAVDGDLRAVEGRVARSPSFWTRWVEVRRVYARIDGARVPVTLESTASVRLGGKSTFLMTYTYEQINGRSVAGGNR